MVDLDRWFSGDYRVPGEPADPATEPEKSSETFDRSEA